MSIKTSEKRRRSGVRAVRTRAYSGEGGQNDKGKQKKTENAHFSKAC
jgi:hypothetical protein